METLILRKVGTANILIIFVAVFKMLYLVLDEKLNNLMPVNTDMIVNTEIIPYFLHL